MTIEKIEKGLNGLETGIEEVKLMNLELNKTMIVCKPLLSKWRSNSINMRML
ncbi:hypothetical protein [Legionella cherrii]|uniref:Uncharacterized protein n=1 Tax=Legionella cherrii TaxID=28084 RepID=A0ABY6T9X9_9GAMM|nr:hypothetical protein [Legionella cherrii]VEB39314.1 Uncharacterised protein [Legionella cherrii]